MHIHIGNGPCNHQHSLQSPHPPKVDCPPEVVEQYKDLVDLAVEARNQAYTPNSHSQVGSAVLTKSGKTYSSANFEFTPYADHGEQMALAFALKAGEKPKDIVACATFVAKEGPPKQEDFHKQSKLTSCGNCRQAIFEINPDMHGIVLAEDGENVEVYKIADMLPKAYRRDKTTLPNDAKDKSDHPDPLIAQALIARSRSYVPRSNEPVGAAIETGDGSIFTGIRVETSSFSTQELRVALADALMHGKKDIKRITLVGGSNENGSLPSRISWDSIQAVAQQAPNAEVLLPDGQGNFKSLSMAEVPGYLLTR